VLVVGRIPATEVLVGHAVRPPLTTASSL
jgi:hypothetical protein